MGQGRLRVARLRHEPALDGLRALAVVAVLAYHDGRLRGGFLGVSTFFTLSGFLITWLLLSERDRAGRVSLRRFFARRVRRLLPAALAGVALAAMIAPLLADPTGTRGVRADGLAAIANLANWHFVLAGRSYVDQFASVSPVLHFWSLSVEEQFYLVLAPAIVGLLAVARGRRIVLAAGIVAAGTASFATGWQIAGSGAIDRAYYGTDVRAVEFLAGALVAVAYSAGALPKRFSRAVSVAGAVALIALALATVNARETDPGLFRGGLLAYAMLGTVSLVAACEPGPLRSALSWRPLRALGRISYGVYLFHWPIFLLFDTPRTGLVGARLTALRVGATLAVATASFVALEQPIRTGRRLARPRSWVVASAGVVAVTVLIMIAAARAPAPAIVFAPANSSAVAAAEHLPLQTVSEPSPTSRNSDAENVTSVKPVGTRLLVVGDSIALTLGRGIERWGTMNGITVMNGGALGCTLQDNARVRGSSGVTYRPEDPCRSHQRWPEVLTAFAPDVVVALYGAWDVYDASWDNSGTWHAPGDPEWDRRYAIAIDDAVARLSARGATVVWLTPPCFRGAPGDVATNGEWYDPARIEALGTIADRVAARNGMRISRTLTELECPEVNLDIRPDGAHYSEGGADRTADALAPDILRALGR